MEKIETNINTQTVNKTLFVVRNVRVPYVGLDHTIHFLDYYYYRERIIFLEEIDEGLYNK